jgi:hypothetical protein
MNSFVRSLPILYTFSLFLICVPLYATLITIEINEFSSCHHISIVITDDHQDPHRKERLDRWGETIMNADERIIFNVDLDYKEVKQVYNDIKLGAGGCCCYENCADEVELFFSHLLEKISEKTQAEIAMEPDHQFCTPFFCCLCFFPQVCCCTLPYSVFNRIKSTVREYPEYLKPVKNNEI